MPTTITPKLKPLFKAKTPFYKTKTFKIIILSSFIVIIAIVIFLILGIDYGAQTLEKSAL